VGRWGVVGGAVVSFARILVFQRLETNLQKQIRKSETNLQCACTLAFQPLKKKKKQTKNKQKHIVSEKEKKNNL
jgi:beta-lactamase regulating signal transducer with metallopeptidase domain